MNIVERIKRGQKSSSEEYLRAPKKKLFNRSQFTPRMEWDDKVERLELVFTMGVNATSSGIVPVLRCKIGYESLVFLQLYL